MLLHCTEYMLWVNENLKSCLNKNKKEYVVALTGYRNVAHVRPGVRPIRFRTLFVNNSYRRYAVWRTTSVVAYVRQRIVNSHPGYLATITNTTVDDKTMKWTGSGRQWFVLRVATPFWRDGKPPEDVNTSEDEDAEFKCNVNGHPRPTITWMINGRPLGVLPVLWKKPVNLCLPVRLNLQWDNIANKSSLLLRWPRNVAQVEISLSSEPLFNAVWKWCFSLMHLCRLNR